MKNPLPLPVIVATAVAGVIIVVGTFIWFMRASAPISLPPAKPTATGRFRAKFGISSSPASAATGTASGQTNP